MKAIWKGSISFGLVNIPVKLYSGTNTHNVNLDMIRQKDKCQIQYVRVCKKDGKEVPWEEIAKGYRKENGDYVVIDKSDFAKIAPEKTQTIEIFEFVKLGAMQFTLILGANSAANARVKPSTAPFAEDTIA